jgi:hypothetical protein
MHKLSTRGRVWAVYCLIAQAGAVVIGIFDPAANNSLLNHLNRACHRCN